MIHLREYIPTQLTGRIGYMGLCCTDILPTWMAKHVIVATARSMAEDAP